MIILTSSVNLTDVRQTNYWKKHCKFTYFFIKTRLEASITFFFTGRFPSTFIAFYQILEKWKLGITHLWGVWGHPKSMFARNFQFLTLLPPLVHSCLFYMYTPSPPPLPPPPSMYVCFSELCSLMILISNKKWGVKREKKNNFFVNWT